MATNRPIPTYWRTRNLLLTAPKGGHFRPTIKSRRRGKTLLLCRDCVTKFGGAWLILTFRAKDAGATGNCDNCGQGLTALPEGE